jgi:hypothetical protein
VNAVLAGLRWTLTLLAILGGMLARLVGLAVLVAAVVAVLAAVELAPAASVKAGLMAFVVIMALR